MSDVLTANIITAIPPTLLALAAVIVAIKSSKKLDHITVLTNSQMAKATKKIGELEKVIRGLVKNPGSEPTDQKPKEK